MAPIAILRALFLHKDTLTMTGNRVMRLNNNPNARGFIVRVLEETHRDEMDNIYFKVIAAETAGTKAKAYKIYDRLKAELIKG